MEPTLGILAPLSFRRGGSLWASDQGALAGRAPFDISPQITTVGVWLLLALR